VNDTPLVLERARARLGADVVYAVHFADDVAVVGPLAGAGDEFGLHSGRELPLEQTMALHVAGGSVPSWVPDVQREPGAAEVFEHWPTSPGSYLGVPFHLACGRLAGVLAAAFRSAQDDSVGRGGEMLSLVAQLMGPDLAPGDGDRHEEEERSRIRSVIDDRSFRTVFQPIVDIATRRTLAVEALTRFDVKPSRPPNLWFAEAGRVGLGIDLELIAIEQALARAEQALPRHLQISLNVSLPTLLSGALDDVLLAGNPAALVIELTENVAIDDYGSVLAVTEGLRERGVRLAIDDFGSGFAGFSHLHGLRPEVVKIDGGLVRCIDDDPYLLALIGAIAAFASASGSSCIAEGIETSSQLRSLLQMGVRVGQGYLFAKPTEPGSIRDSYPVDPEFVEVREIPIALPLKAQRRVRGRT
jgi:EAL domain-containing protein (putative c-di-GMP-specific phosphodiesterase class I)